MLLDKHCRGTATMFVCYHLRLGSCPMEKTMIRTAFAIALTALTVACVSGVAQAAPIAPLASSVTSDHANVTHVRWHCWIGRWGHRHCGW
jgi:hypothetical protein